MSTTTYTSYDAIRAHGELRETASVLSDGVSAVRNTATSVSSAVSGLGALATAAAALKILNGPILVGVGACMLRDTHYKVVEARNCGHTEGVARHALYGSMGAGLTAVGGMVTADAIAALANLSPSAHVVLPSAMGAIALPVAVIGMYASQLIYSAHGLYIGSKFSSDLEKVESSSKAWDEDSGPETQKPPTPYEWLLAQLTKPEEVLSKKEYERLADSPADKIDNVEGQVSARLRHKFELRAGKEATDLLLAVNKANSHRWNVVRDDNSRRFSEDFIGALKSYSVEKVKEAVYKKKVTNYLLFVIALVGITLGALLLTNPVGWMAIALAIVSAMLAMAWLSIDSSKLNERFSNWCWERKGIDSATKAMKGALGSEELSQQLKNAIDNNDVWNRYFAHLVPAEKKSASASK